MNIREYFTNTYKYILHTMRLGIPYKIAGSLFMTLFYYFNIHETNKTSFYFAMEGVQRIDFLSLEVSSVTYGIIRMMSVILISIVLRLCADYCISTGGITMIKEIQMQLAHLMQKTDGSFFLRHPHGVISEVFSRHINMIDQMHNTLFIELIPGLFAFIALIFTLKHELRNVLLIFCSIFIIIVLIKKRLSKHIMERQGKYSSERSNSIVELITASLITKIFKAENFTYNKVKYCVDKEMSNKMKHNFFNNTSFNILFSFCFFFIVPSIVNIITSSFTIESIRSEYMNFSRIILLFGFRVGAIGKIANIISELPQTLNIFADMTFDEDNNLLSINKPSAIVIKNLNFSLNDIQLFRNFNLTINSRDKILIIGSSGVGKSTLLNLIARITKAPNNTIFAKQNKTLIDINDIASNSWYDHISYVMQDSYMIPGSFRDNILMGREASQADIERAIRQAELTDKINEIGLDAYIAKLSGGQKQRLALARFFLKDYSLILLDEISSGLDSKNSLKILKTILNTYKNQSILAISHDTSWVNYFDKILYLDSDCKYYLDTHENLYKSNDEYKQFFVMEDYNKDNI